MEKIKIKGSDIVPPMPVALVGSMVEGKVNFMTVAWMTRVNFKPPMLAVALNKNHYTPKGIVENKTFSVNFPNTTMTEVTDYCGIASGKKVDKSEIFDLFYGETKTAPMISECPLNVECKLIQVVDCPTNNLYIGEIISGYSSEKYLQNGKPDFKALDLMLLTMPDNNYWSFGEIVGKAWKDGKKFRN